MTKLISECESLRLKNKTIENAMTIAVNERCDAINDRESLQKFTNQVNKYY